MIGRTVGTVALAASALTAQAILLPPGVASIENNLDPSNLAIDTTSQAIKLPCSDCVFGSKEEKTESADGDDMFWIQGGANSLFLNFSIGDNGSAMKLNGYTLFPPSVNLDKPTIKQVASSASFVDIKASTDSPVQVSSDFIFVSEESVSPAGDSVVHVKYQILQVDNQPVSVDGAEVTLLKSPAGELMILAVEPVPKPSGVFDSLPPTVVEIGKPALARPHPAADCGMLPAFICGMKNTMEGKINELKAGLPKKMGGCRGKKLPGHLKPHFEVAADEARPHHHHGRPPKFHGGPGKFSGHHGPHGPHGAHHGHHHHHRHMLGKFLMGIVMVLVPIMMGITMGMFVSLLGMLIGRLVVFLWIKFVRGGQRGYASVALDEDEAENGTKDEVIVFEEVEPLPRYEEAPAYTEKEQE